MDRSKLFAFEMIKYYGRLFLGCKIKTRWFNWWNGKSDVSGLRDNKWSHGNVSIHIPIQRSYSRVPNDGRQEGFGEFPPAEKFS